MGVMVAGPVSLYVLGRQKPVEISYNGGFSADPSININKVQILEDNSIGGTPSLLGVGETGVYISIKGKYKEIFSDLGGEMVPHDLMYMGQEAIVTTVMTVSNWQIMQWLSCRPKASKAIVPNTTVFGGSTDAEGDGSITTIKAPISSPIPPGTDPASAVGDLIRLGGSAVHLYVWFPYVNKTINSGLVSGYHFLNAVLMDTNIDVGNKASKVPVTFRCLRSHDTDTGRWKLYDNDLGPTPKPPYPKFKDVTTVPLSGFLADTPYPLGFDPNHGPPIPVYPPFVNPYTGQAIQ